MKGQSLFKVVAFGLPLALGLLAGCSKQPREREYGGITPRRVDPTEMSRGAGTGIESQDLLEVTDKSVGRRVIVHSRDFTTSELPRECCHDFWTRHIGNVNISRD